MNLINFLAGVRAQITPTADDDRITVRWVDANGRVVASHTATDDEPIDYRLGLHGDDDDLDVELSYRGRPVYKLSKRLWDALDPDNLSTVPDDILHGIVTGCEAVEADDEPI